MARKHVPTGCTALKAILWLFVVVAGPAAVRASEAESEEPAELIAATRHVIGCVTQAGKQDIQAQPNEVVGDLLTEHYIRAAAVAAKDLPPDVGPKAFLLGVAIACDSADGLRQLPLIGGYVEKVESAQERKQRWRTFKRPTIWGREDLAQHFLVCGYLTARLGPAAAEAAGMAKEFQDSQGGSGFSFADLAADKAGVRFANQLLQQQLTLADIAESFEIEKFMPGIERLEEGISADDLKERYGSTTDKRFLTVVEEIDRRIHALGERKQ